MSPHAIEQLIVIGTMSAATLIAAIGITVRFALMPLIKARRQPLAPPPDAGRLEARMDAIEEEVRQIGHSVQRVAEVVEFDARLRVAGSQLPARLPGSAE